MPSEIGGFWKDIREGRDVRVAILPSAGERHFCAGHDLVTRADVSNAERKRIRAESI